MSERDDNPFPGPRPYGKSDAAIYPGREIEARRVLDHATAFRCFLLHGPSSAGKSSLMQAAVLPELEKRRHRTVTIDQWPEDEKTSPPEQLLRALSAQLDVPRSPALGLADDLDDLLDGADERSDDAVVVYLDQLEQLLYATRDPKPRAEVFALMDQLASRTTPDVRLVLTVREDYMGLFRHRGRRWPRLLERTLRLGSLTVDEMAAAVCRGAEKRGQSWDREQLRSMVGQMCAPGQLEPVLKEGSTERPKDDREVESAFVQIVCRALFEERKGTPPESWPALQSAQDVVQKYLGEALTELDRAHPLGPRPLSEVTRDFLEREMVDEEGHRRVRTGDEMKSLLPDEVRKIVLDHLNQKAILRWQSHGDRDLVELGHDWLASKLLERKRDRLSAEAQEQARIEQEEKRQEERERLEKENLRAKVAAAEAEKAVEQRDRLLVQARADADQARAWRTRNLAIFGFVAVSAAATVYLTWDWKERKKSEVEASDRSSRAREITTKADKLASVSALMLADGRLDHAVRGLGSSTDIVYLAREILAKNKKGETPEEQQSTPKSLLLADRRALAMAGNAAVRSKVKASARDVAIEPGARTAAVISDDGLAVILLDLASDTTITALATTPQDDPVPGRLEPAKNAAATDPAPAKNEPTKKAVPADPVPVSVERVAWFKGPLRRVDIVPGGAFVVGYADGGQVAVWSFDGTLIQRFRTTLESPVLQLSGDGKRLLFGTKSGEGAVLAAADEDRTVALDTPSLQPLSAVDPGWQKLSRRWQSLKLGADGTRLFAIWSEEYRTLEGRREARSEAHVLAADTGKLLYRLPFPRGADDIVFSPAGDLIAFTTPDDTVHLWKLGERDKDLDWRSLSAQAAVNKLSFERTDLGPLLVVWTLESVIGYDPAELPPAAEGAAATKGGLGGARRPPASASAGDELVPIFRPGSVFDIPLGAPALAISVQADRSHVLVRLADEARAYASAQSIPLAALPLPELSSDTAGRHRENEQDEPSGGSARLALFFAPRSRSNMGIATLAEHVLRVRWLGENQDAVQDHLVWTPVPAAPPIRSASFGGDFRLQHVVPAGDSIGIVASSRLYRLSLSSGDTPSLAAREQKWANHAFIWDAAGAAGTLAAADVHGNLLIVPREGQRLPAPLRMPGFQGVAFPSLAVSASGEWVATGGNGPKVQLWEAATAALAWAGDLRAHGNEEIIENNKYSRLTVLAAGKAMFPSGQGMAAEQPFVVTGNVEGGVRLMRTGGLLPSAVWTALDFKSPHHKEVTAIEVSAGGVVASGSADGTLGVWNAEGEPLSVPERPGEQKASISMVRVWEQENEIRVVAVGDDGSARIVAPGKPWQCTLSGSGVIDDVQIETAARIPRVITHHAGGIARVWSLEDCPAPRLERSFRNVEHAGFVQRPAASEPDRFVTMARSGRVDLWEGSPVREPGPRGRLGWGVLPDEARLLTAGDDGKVYSLAVSGPAAPHLEEAGSPLESTAFTAAAPGALAVVGETGTLLYWKEGSFRRFQLHLDEGFRVRAAALSKSELRVVAESTAGILSHATLDLATLTEKAKAPPWPVAAPAWTELRNPEAPQDACGTSAEEATKLATPGRTSGAAAVGDTLWTVSVDRSGCVRFFDAKGAVQSARGPAGESAAVALSSTGDRLVIGGSTGSVSIWNVALGPPGSPEKLTLTLRGADSRRHTGAVRAIAFHPSGRFAVTGSDDGSAWLWDTQEGWPFVQLGSHPAPVRWIAFTPSGDYAVTGGDDGWVRAWDTRTGDTDLGVLRESLNHWLPSDPSSFQPLSRSSSTEGRH